MGFYFLSFLLGAIALIFGLSRVGSKKLSSLPRQKIAGLLVGTVCLIWSAKESCIMLSGDLAKYHTLVWGAVPFILILCWFYLDFLLARSLGGLLVLIVNQLIRYAFICAIPARGLYSGLAVIWGIWGLVLLGAPWYWRILLEQSVQKKWLGNGVLALGVLSALAFLSLPFFGNLGNLG